MVKRVFGRVDGCEVELNRSEGDWWNVPVPFDTDGEYVVEIHARDQAPFTIRDATWELKGNYETEAQGECEINGDVIRAMIAPQKRVTYRLYFTYKVAEEILMECIEVVAE